MRRERRWSTAGVYPPGNGRSRCTEETLCYERIHRLYDFTPTALREIDDAHARISLEMELDEQTQFHVGKVEVLGAEPATETFCSRRQSLAMF